MRRNARRGLTLISDRCIITWHTRKIKYYFLYFLVFLMVSAGFFQEIQVEKSRYKISRIIYLPAPSNHAKDSTFRKYRRPDNRQKGTYCG